MAYKYVIGECMTTENECLTEEDRATAFIRKFHGNVWVVADTEAVSPWIQRNQFTEVTYEEAQTQVNAQFANIIDPLTNLPMVPPALPI